MKQLRQINDMYTLCGGMASSGWYGAGLVLSDVDRPYLDSIEALFFGEEPFSTHGEEFDSYFNHKANADKHDGIVPEAWIQAATHARRTLVYFDQRANEQILTVADRIYGPVSPSGKTDIPCIAWIEKPTFEERYWKLRFFDGQSVTTVTTRTVPMAAPAAAVMNGKPLFAFATGTHVEIVGVDGTPLAHVQGKYPVLAATDDELLLIVERTDRAHGILSLVCLNPLNKQSPETVLQRDELNLHAHAVAHEGSFYVAFESRPSWGADHLLAMTSCIHVVKLMHKDITDLPPVPQLRMGFKETQLQTIQSVHIGMPHLFIEKGGLCLSAKRFRADGFRMNRWDLYVSRLERSGFTPFERVSEHFGAPDTGYAVLESPQGLISMAAVYNEKDMCREFETHAEVILIADERLPRIDPPKALRDHYQWAYSAAGLGREIAMPLTVPHYTALRGDVHNHTLYSKCMSSPDGAPDEAVRYYLDILGMNLLCFTDHTDRIGFAQHTWTIDRLEELAGDEAVVLYGMEPSAAPDHDTNYYAATRQEAERLRLCTLYSLRRDKVYRSIRHHMPEGRAAAIRHCHGRIDGACGIYTNQTLTTHMPDLEWGMEALQLRGNLILGESFENPERHFPCNFLNSGAKLALLGGTDHDLQMVLNHVGYTGFWAEDTSAEAALRAIRQRKTYAVANGLLQLWTEWDGRPMGSEMGLQQRVAIHYQVAAARPIRAVALLCDGELLPWQPVEPALNVNGLLTDEAPTTGPHWYSVVVKGDSFFTEDTVAARMPLAMAGAGQVRNDCCMAFASPYFVTLSNNGFYHK